MAEEPITPRGADEQGNDRMQRIRVGLTGLAVVLVLVALVTAVFTRVNNSAPPGANASVTKDNSKDEPLANLGVTPGAPANEAVPPPVPATVPLEAPNKR